MIFPTFDFLIFFVLVWPLAWGAIFLGRHTLHKCVIITASFVFYSFKSIY